MKFFIDTANLAQIKEANELVSIFSASIRTVKLKKSQTLN